ncbi:hypothetical protein [Mycobacterium sp. SMC-4]|uniref:hypothetical protein n=1 Tax=Mycobacterium sp. SMC-4 TaxID=2857059 RepID=UPI0021B4B134|nr:hypothetical protein [Mycobacterium sp. SMC-4]UXA19111.1 hypothetical protein KXD98_05545 [Mycobacterium sp. SMC-4]
MDRLDYEKALNVRRTLAVGAAASLLALTGCSNADSPNTPPAPRTDDEKISVLWSEFRQANLDRDTTMFLRLTCPNVRSEIHPEKWFDDFAEMKEDQLPGPDDALSEPFDAPDGGKDAPNASQWRRIVFLDKGGHIRVAKIDDDWYVCET